MAWPARRGPWDVRSLQQEAPGKPRLSPLPGVPGKIQ